MTHRLGRSVHLPIDGEYFISLFSGVESGLAITAGIVAGLIASTNDRNIVLSTALIAIVVQAFNSASVRMSEQRIQDVLDHSAKRDGLRKPLIDALAVLVAHMLAGFVLLVPLVYAPTIGTALLQVIAITFGLLMLLGIVRVKMLHSKDPLAEIGELVIIGALVICAGLLSGFALDE